MKWLIQAGAVATAMITGCSVGFQAQPSWPGQGATDVAQNKAIEATDKNVQEIAKFLNEKFKAPAQAEAKPAPGQ